MKLWVWFAIAALWLILPQAAIHNVGLLVYVKTGKHLPDNGARDRGFPHEPHCLPRWHDYL